MNERLAAKRGENTRFFVFADTSPPRATPARTTGTAGWASGSRTGPGAEPSQIILHVSLLDRETTLQQEAIGILGVNLIHAALYEAGAGGAGPASCSTSLSHERIEVDLIEFSGPAFAEVDNRLMSLELVHCGLTDAAMFTADGKVVQPAEVFYKRPILVVRGRFRPVTNRDRRHAPLRPRPVHAGAGQPGRGRPGRHRDDPAAPPGRRRRSTTATSSIASTSSGRSAGP